MKINKEGYKIIAVSGLICLVLWALMYHFIKLHINSALFILSTVILVAFWFFIVAFFREPRRVKIHDADLVFSPCDGRVVVTEVVYEDESLLVVNKPSGVLSVPGVVGGVSVQQWLRDEYQHSNELFMVHRLDMATSGLLVAAKSMETFKMMQRLFASREVVKHYTALLQGVPRNSSGVVELPLAPDYMNRPRQKVDYLNGKPAITHYKVIGAVERDGRQCAVVHFEPVTGRTHQLRVHAAHKDGLDCPILGDSLYGTAGERLMLHASRISFAHPAGKGVVTLECNDISFEI